MENKATEALLEIEKANSFEKRVDRAMGYDALSRSSDSSPYNTQEKGGKQ